MKSAERGILSEHDLKKTGNKVVYGIMVFFIAVMVFTMMYPILMTMFNGLKSNVEVNSFPPHFFPQEWHFGNLKDAVNYIDLLVFLKNTIYIFAGNMIVTLVVLGMASFSISRMNVPYRKAFYFFFLMTLFIPATSYMIPNFVNLKELGLLNQYAAFWLPAGANTFYFLLLKNFFDGIHPEIFEAARIDGASEPRSFFAIAVPLSVPIFATLAIFIFSTAWNDWFWPSLVMHSEEKYTLATAIYKYVISVKALNTNIKFAILFLVSLPPILVFLIFQKFIMRGVALSAVKG
ncbi:MULTISPECIES: carbohydrate ABC transporter permease [unclassified Paenibacillus]|uniref:carbohydrate ABC transporter permease n=1 Tax=unclassified Paenibacillus TaxID=185978 RepID=UPI0024065845|nr:MULTISPECIES: carbohydrate ABC transporter permease [unclassified Paenibacillus]MDF9840525.1 multiple sugar transport system permease protein [Paenibacillus sp. PastF-2]MDF9847107.1 multiple sugar transport system permease protein [Paenibacillus sp. PastM-2]MDF9853679.1 multiple sugar transport system permease protein [Paenibacillus sp. PastF-1]MDH6478835.1 multiple sugar transport system permease protein [Paenibacillus sp. PastH-2]MDH6506567.1 multiple sugar transport system permease prote